MPEDVPKNFEFHNFTAPVSGTPMKLLDNDTTTRDNPPSKDQG